MKSVKAAKGSRRSVWICHMLSIISYFEIQSENRKNAKSFFVYDSNIKEIGMELYRVNYD